MEDNARQPYALNYSYWYDVGESRDEEALRVTLIDGQQYIPIEDLSVVWRSSNLTEPTFTMEEVRVTDAFGYPPKQVISLQYALRTFGAHLRTNAIMRRYYVGDVTQLPPLMLTDAISRKRKRGEKEPSAY